MSRRTGIGIVHRADADEPDGGTGLRVVALNRDPASRAAGDHLALPARRRRAHDFRLAGGVHDLIGLIERVERMRCPGLALTPAAMTGMNDQWRSNQSISDLPASASAFHIRLHRGGDRLGARARTNAYSFFFPQTQRSACSPNHSRTKFLSIPDVFKPMNALP